MKRFSPTLLCISLLAAPACAQQPGSTAPEQVLVVGQRPGPGLWKVSKDEHVLWVFGTYEPLPAKMQWRSQEVEAIIAQSQELLGAPGTGLSVGWIDTLNILTALPTLIGADKNVNGERLQEVVPAQTYARWSALKTKYIGSDDSGESLRPMFAAELLFTSATSKAGLANSAQIEKRVYAVAKQHQLKLTSTRLNIVLENPRGALKDFKKSTFDDLECFTKTIDRLETDLDGMRLRANAWAVGDIAKMRALAYPDQAEACHTAMTGSAWMQGLKGAQDIDARAKAMWLAAAEKALANNRATFALMPVSKALRVGGYLDALKDKGYLVEQPE